ncbi:MAG TPA: multidrug transporter [Rhizobium sp.]
MSDDLRVSHLRWRRLRNFLLVIFGLVGGGIATGHLLSGSIVLLDVDGVVARDRVAIASPFSETRIRDVFVRPGDHVTAGQKIAVVESTSVSASLASLAVEKAKLSNSLAEIEARQSAVEALLPTAEAAAKQVKTSLDRISRANANGIVPDKTLTDMTSTNLTTADKLLSLRAEQASLAKQIASQQDALRDVTASYEQFRKSYADGVLHAPVGGFVGSKVEPAGSVLNSDKSTITEIFTGPNYVFAYLPASYEFTIKAGERVKIKTSSRWTVGTIESLLPLTDALPPEFQLPTKVRERGQLVKVALPTDADFPLGEKILLSGCYFDSCNADTDFHGQLNLMVENAKTFIGTLRSSLP